MPNPSQLDFVLGYTALNGTDIVLSGPESSLRGVIEQIAPIGASANLVRDINATLQDWSLPEFFKFAMTVSCSDIDAPALGHIRPGTALIVDCKLDFCYRTEAGVPAGKRPSVPSSESVYGDFTFYRPRLSMRAGVWSQSVNVWNAETSWSLPLEEI